MTGSRPLLHTSIDSKKFAASGARAVQWIEDRGLWIVYFPLVYGVGMALYVMPILVSVELVSVWSLIFLLPFSALSLWLRNGQKLREVEEASRISAEDDRVTLETVGNIRSLLDDCINLRNAEKSAGEFVEAMARHQTQFLKSAIDKLRNRHGLASVSLRASWMTRDGDELVLRRFDNLAPERRTTRRLPIREGVPGAPAACLLGHPTVIEDITDAAVNEWFPDSHPRPYRCILSVPVEDGKGRCVGVLNVDANKPRVFNVSHASHLLETAYLVGLCEILSGRLSNAP